MQNQEFSVCPGGVFARIIFKFKTAVQRNPDALNCLKIIKPTGRR